MSFFKLVLLIIKVCLLNEHFINCALVVFLLFSHVLNFYALDMKYIVPLLIIINYLLNNNPCVC